MTCSGSIVVGRAVTISHGMARVLGRAVMESQVTQIVICVAIRVIGGNMLVR
jgi:hypothetical protein